MGSGGRKESEMETVRRRQGHELKVENPMPVCDQFLQASRLRAEINYCPIQYIQYFRAGVSRLARLPITKLAVK